MVIIEQPWEKNNLGVNSAEFCFDQTDRLDELKKQGIDLCEKYNYQLARIPAGRMDIAYWLEENGFRFAEVSIEIEAAMKTLKLPEYYKEIDANITEHAADNGEIEAVYEKIRKGIFDTDKIALDPWFGMEQSGRRFANWCRQEVESGNGRMYIVNHLNTPIGFYVLKEENEKAANSMLAGLFEREKYLGFGYAVLYYPMLRAKNEGKKKIRTKVSSNNPASLKMQLYLGYAVKRLNYVYVKHRSGRKQQICGGGIHH